MTTPFNIHAWDDNDQLVAGPCYSPTEALAVALDEAADRLARSERDGWWRHRLLKLIDQMRPEIDLVAQDCGTTGPQLDRYIREVAGYSDKTGKTSIYAKRSAIAERMGGVSTSVVDRCRKAANRLGFHERIKQLKWINEDKGPNPWCGGPAVFVLTAPKAARSVAAKAEAIADRVAARLAQKRRERADTALRLKKARAKAHEEKMARLVASQPEPAPTNPGRWTPEARRALSQARQVLSAVNTS